MRICNLILGLKGLNKQKQLLSFFENASLEFTITSNKCVKTQQEISISNLTSIKLSNVTSEFTS